jgi:hypothetical protein
MAPAPAIFENGIDSYDNLDKSNMNLLAREKMPNMSIEPILEKCLITSHTWDRECHGLYDFDLTKIDKIENKFVGCGYVQRIKNNVSMQLPGLAAEQAEQAKEDD